MKNKLLFVTVVLTSMLLLSSCSMRIIDFTVISSRNHSLNFDLSQAKEVEGSSIQFLAIGVTIKDAMDDALKNAGPEYDLLVNGVVREVSYFIAAGYKVEGLAVSSRKLKAELGEEGFIKWCEDNNVFVPEEATVMNE